MRWALALLWLLGCGAPADPSSSATSTSTSTSPSPSPSPSPATAPSTAPGPVADEIEARSVPFAGGALLAERCVLPLELTAPEAFDALRAIAWSGADVWLLDAAGTLHHVVDAGDEACALVETGEPLPLGARWLATDEAGRVHASSGTELSRITNGEVDLRCDVAGRVTVAPDGATALALAANRTAQRITFGPEGCTLTPWVPAEAPSILESLSFVANDRVLVGGQRGAEGMHVIRAYGLDGQPLGERIGSDDASRADRFCYVHGVYPCTGGLCVLDGNCRSLSRLDAAGAPLGRADLSELTGLSAPWLVAPSGIDHGMTFLGAAEAALEGDGTRRWRGHVLRVHGL